MPTEEDRVRELLRQAYQSAENAPWDLSPEAIRGRRRRYSVALPDPKLLAAVAAVAVLIVTGFFVIGNPPSHNASVSSIPSTTTTILTSTPTLVVTPSTNLRNGQTIRVLLCRTGPPGRPISRNVRLQPTSVLRVVGPRWPFSPSLSSSTALAPPPSR